MQQLELVGSNPGVLLDPLPEVYNDFNSIRLYLVQKCFGLKHSTVKIFYNKKNELVYVKKWVQTKPLTEPMLKDLVGLYCEFRDTVEVVPIKYVYRGKEMIDCEDLNLDPEKYVNYLNMKGINASHYKGWITRDCETFEFDYPVACKRGNDIYIEITRKRLKPLIEQEPKTFFDTTVNRNRKINRYTNMLYLTGTTDPKNIDIAGAWLVFPNHWNSFITNLRKQFGDLVFIRSWQSQENGYPHFHAIIYFKNINFSAVPNWGAHGLSWRISSRQKLHKGDKLTIRQRLKQAWGFGNLDIVCVDNTQDCFKDLLKYVTRDLEGGESDLTNAMIWYFGKHSFAFSRNFIEMVWGQKEPLALEEPDNADLINPNMCNSNPELIRIEIYPSIRRDFLFKKRAETWQQDINLCEDPPPFEVFNEDMLNSLTWGYVLKKAKKTKFEGVPVFIWVRGDLNKK